MQSLNFSNGYSIPTVGLGTWTSPPDQVKIAVKEALSMGYRHIDCAYVYKNEAAVGEALHESLSELQLKREDIFITSKLWCTFFRPELVQKACLDTLEKLKLKYLDLYLVHWPVPFQPGGADFPIGDGDMFDCDDVPHVDTWKEMEKLVEKGLVRSIGLSNFNKRQIENILEHSKIKPVNLQVEIHANFPNSLLVDYAKSVGLTVTAYAPLGSPGASPGATNLLTEPWVVSIATHHNKTPAQVLIRYLLQRGLIVIPKSVTPERIKENFGVFDFQLTDEQMHTLNTSGLNQRQFLLKKMGNHKEYPFNDSY